MKKYRAELNNYNRQHGNYGNGDNEDASHKDGKITGYENQSTNRARKDTMKKKYKKGDLVKKQGAKVAKKAAKTKGAKAASSGPYTYSPLKGKKKEGGKKLPHSPVKSKVGRTKRRVMDKAKDIAKELKPLPVRKKPSYKEGGKLEKDVYKKTGKGGKLEKKIVKGATKAAEKFEKVMGIDPSNTEKQNLGVMGGAMTGGVAGSTLGPIGALAGIVGGARAGKKLMTKSKKKDTKPSYKEGALVRRDLKTDTPIGRKTMEEEASRQKYADWEKSRKQNLTLAMKEEGSTYKPGFIVEGDQKFVKGTTGMPKTDKPGALWKKSLLQNPVSNIGLKKYDKGGSIPKMVNEGEVPSSRLDRIRETLQKLVSVERQTDRDLNPLVKPKSDEEILASRKYGGPVAKSAGEPVAVYQASNSNYKEGE